LGNRRAFERRTYLEIIASILDVCRPGTRRTRVMGMCGMSSKQLTGYLDMLLEANLLSIENDSRSPLFRASGKGKYFLQAYNSMMNMLE
jgi:predicted transcriptional regulator